jgi:demethylmenaquinone methyltransferase/2-methoxy-6-polyprenyl-1,4-benzoquinol methylase
MTDTTDHDTKKVRIAAMFDGIAQRYDLLNHLLSLNVDKRWRRIAATVAAQSNPQTALDAAAGTADMAIALAQSGIPKIVGIDISQKMIDIGQQKVHHLRLTDTIRLQTADGEHLPFDDESFDVAAIAFGIRNYADRKRGFSELLRVLRPQGHLVTLEFSMPASTLVRWAYTLYFCKILPCIGKIISRHSSAYNYLQQSVRQFPTPDALCSEMLEAGFAAVDVQPLTLGIVHLYNAKK